MNWFRSIAAILSAPVIYGVICVPSVGFLMSSSPELLNEQGGTFDVTLTLTAELIQFVVLVACGYFSALIAGREELKHGLAVTVVMLAIAIGTDKFLEQYVGLASFCVLRLRFSGNPVGYQVTSQAEGNHGFPGTLVW